MERGTVPFDNASIDLHLLINNQVIEQVKNLDSVLAEIQRVLKPGGMRNLSQSWPHLPGLPSLSWWRTPLLAALMLCAGLALTSARVEAAYTVVELATNLPEESGRVVRALNDDGEIVGAGPGGGRHRGFLLKGGGGRQDINGLPGSDYSAALGINLAGQVVGSTNTHTGVRAFRSLRTNGILDLGTLPGDSSSVALAINDSGQAVGFSSGPTGVRAVVWARAGAIKELPGLPGSNSSRALAIDAQGNAAGVSDTATGPRAVFWRGGSVQDLGTLPGHDVSEALGINNSGDIVGSSGDPETQQRRAVLWASGAAIQDLGTLPGGKSSRALGISNRGEVVGTSGTNNGIHAFLWTQQGGMQDLNDLLTSRSGFVLTHAVAISSPRGRILAIGQDDTVADDHERPVRIFLLTQ